jgi:hypothetical protein
VTVGLWVSPLAQDANDMSNLSPEATGPNALHENMPVAPIWKEPLWLELQFDCPGQRVYLLVPLPVPPPLEVTEHVPDSPPPNWQFINWFWAISPLQVNEMLVMGAGVSLATTYSPEEPAAPPMIRGWSHH